MNSLVKNILIVVVALGIIGGAFGVYLFTKKVDSTKEMKADYSLKMEDLYGEFDKDEKAAFNKFKDKVIEVTGVVTAKGGADAQHVDVTLGSDAVEGTVSISLETDQVEKSNTIKEGSNVVIKGICTGIQSGGGEGGGSMLDALGKEVQLKRGIIISGQ